SGGERTLAAFHRPASWFTAGTALHLCRPGQSPRHAVAAGRSCARGQRHCAKPDGMTMTEQTAPQLPAPAEDEASLGPAMQVLTPKQRAFVRAYAAGATQAQAVAAAGYSTANPTVISVAGTRLAHDPKIQAALYEENLKAFRTSGLKARV